MSDHWAKAVEAAYDEMGYGPVGSVPVAHMLRAALPHLVDAVIWEGYKINPDFFNQSMARALRDVAGLVAKGDG